ncbi:hypothetical protein [Sphingomonas montanisoli]|uniref:Uncharacterized protein n=1 Tax=Sphingomonas montanisoli TaxID=2606412 RepID=A0A5D9C2Y1_9SPHN|nr:hypothetical protein [Sphingomonas montanisoli]TZG25632.1 hypothetical protein FYJ91_11440 [Sphingomonas montanisoli]
MTNTPASVAVVQASAWLRECSKWLLSNDLDMQCPMEADPLDLADLLDRLAFQQPGGEAVIRTCDGKEQDAFEEWAASQNMDTKTHPIHWLFLDPKTSAARQGWRGATEYWAARMKDAAPTPDAALREALAPEDAWQELVEYDDRTSPEEYPDMALITHDELRSFMERAS